MHLFRLLLALALAPLSLRADEPTPDARFEAEVAAVAAGSHVTVLHFWAPWCDNCHAEFATGGWGEFLARHPHVKVVFVNLWHRGMDPAPRLREAGLGGQPNLTLLDHPNPSSREADKVKTFLGLPLTWTPTTWIFRDGRLRYALSYGELRFDILATLVEDARDKAKWAR